jgi:hypothetical protein
MVRGGSQGRALIARASASRSAEAGRSNSGSKGQMGLSQENKLAQELSRITVQEKRKGVACGVFWIDQKSTWFDTSGIASGSPTMRPIVLLLSGVCALFISRAHAMDGGDWYQECMQWLHTPSEQRKQQSPEKILAQRACRIDAIRIYCNANYEGDARSVWQSASTETRRQWTEHLKKFCPNFDAWTFPFGGPPVVVLRGAEKEGGPGFIETYAPDSWFIGRVFEKLFNGCAQEREKLGLFQEPEKCLDGWIKNMDELDQLK